MSKVAFFNLKAKSRRLSLQFEEHAKWVEGRQITLNELLTLFGPLSPYFLIIFSSLIFLTPIPLPGFSVIMGIIIASGGVAVIFNAKVFLPHFIGKKQIKGELLKKFFILSSSGLKRVEHLLKPRLLYFSTLSLTRFAAGGIIIISGLFLALPLPPGTNFPPALVAVTLALGMVEKDGVIILIGFFLFLVKLVLAYSFFFYLLGWLEKIFL